MISQKSWKSRMFQIDRFFSSSDKEFKNLSLQMTFAKGKQRLGLGESLAILGQVPFFLPILRTHIEHKRLTD